jgi:paraquat-inducible protein B
MAEPTDPGELPTATVVRPRRARFSVVWAIPVIAAAVAAGILVQRAFSEGPSITIVFAAAEGIEAGKTFIKYKDVNIGQVTAVRLTDDFAKVEVTARIAKHSAGLMVEDATFWIVRPNISLTGISGLNTLLSGNYIGFEAGKSQESARTFTGRDVAPFIPGQPGRQFILKAADLGSIVTGSPIFYRRLPVGQVVSFGLAGDGKSVEVRIFINAPYDKYVTLETRFWNASGVDVTIDANGVGVHTESLVALLVGGLAFETPAFLPSTQAAPANRVFTLHADQAAAMKAPDAVARRYVLKFSESLRGLSVGAPVTFLGLQAGEVTNMGLTIDEQSKALHTQVWITFFPERLLAYSDPKQAARVRDFLLKGDKDHALLRRLVEERGLRAQLRSGSLITGQLYVAFEYFPKAPRVKVDWKQEVLELPVAPSSLVELEAKLGSILDKIDKMPLEAIAESLKSDLRALDLTLADARKLIGNVDTQIVPSLKSDLEALHRALLSTEKVMNNVDATLLGPDAPAQQELRDALAEFTRAARSVRVLVDYLERHPESPIRGKVPSSSGGK